MPLSRFVLLASAVLALLLSVALGQPSVNNAAASSPPTSLDADVPVVSFIDADASTGANANSQPIAAAAATNSTDSVNPNATATASSGDDSVDQRAVSSLLAQLDTSQLSAAQRSSLVADELTRMQLLSDTRMSPADRRRLAATMDAWLQLSAEDKLALIRRQQTAYVRAMHAEQRRRLYELARDLDELKPATADGDDAQADDDGVRRIRLIRVHPAHAVAAQFEAAQMQPVVQFDAQQMEAPSQFNMLQMDERYGVY